MDHAVSMLFEDFGNCGLDKNVFVVLEGEFVNSLRIERRAGHRGHNHWGDVSSVLFCSGDFNMGQVIGTTDKNVGHPVDRTLETQDVLARIYYHSRIDTHYRFHDKLAHLFSILSRGEPIEKWYRGLKCKQEKLGTNYKHCSSLAI